MRNIVIIKTKYSLGIFEKGNDDIEELSTKLLEFSDLPGDVVEKIEIIKILESSQKIPKEGILFTTHTYEEAVGNI